MRSNARLKHCSSVRPRLKNTTWKSLRRPSKLAYNLTTKKKTWSGKSSLARRLRPWHEVPICFLSGNMKQSSVNELPSASRSPSRLRWGINQPNALMWQKDCRRSSAARSRWTRSLKSSPRHQSWGWGFRLKGTPRLRTSLSKWVKSE